MNPSSNARRGPSFTSRRGSFPKGLTIDTSSDVVGPQNPRSMAAASALSSARLTPSPHCSPHFSADVPGRGRVVLDSLGARDSQHFVDRKSPFAPRRPDWARQPSSINERGLDGGLGLWQMSVNPPWDAPEAYRAFAAHGTPAAPSLVSCNFLEQPLGRPLTSFDYSYPSNVASFAGNLFTTSSDVGWCTRAPGAVEPRALDGCRQPRGVAVECRGGRDDSCRPVEPGPGRRGPRALPREHVQHVFETRQFRDALPPVHELPSAAKHPPQSQPAGFLPMMAVAEPQKRRSSLAAMQLYASDSNKFSTRYHGMHTESNASADHLGPGQNCALWLTNLPADIDYSELLGAIRNVGRIWCTYINSPDNVKHHTAAAKVVFFSPDAAQKLLTESWTKTIVIRGQRVKASHNRIKYGKNVAVGNMSRVLVITGSADFVNADGLRSWFGERFVFQEDKIIELIKAAGRAVCEFRFGSYRCQAQMGKMALEKDRPMGFEKVEFGDDPCEVGETMASYGIAAERIQGRGL